MSIASATVASTIVSVANAANFLDITGNDHEVSIKALAEQKIVGGYTDGTFKPNGVVTRGNVTKFLGKWLVAENYKIPQDFIHKARFTDLPITLKDTELLQYAALVKDEGVLNVLPINYR